MGSFNGQCKAVSIILSGLGFEAMANDARSGYKLNDHARVAVKNTERYHGVLKARQVRKNFLRLGISC